MLTSVRLVEGSRQMLIRPREGVADTDLDFGFPETRAQVENRPNKNGTRDTTNLFGASAVSLTIELYKVGTTRGLLDELRSFCYPGLRPYIYVADDEWTTERRALLRADMLSAPIAKGTGPKRTVQAQWRNPNGYWESATEIMVEVLADVPISVGSPYPRTYPYSYASTTSTGATLVGNVGLIPSEYTARLYGPCSGPRLVNEDTGDELKFSDELALAAGEYVEVDTLEQSASFMSDENNSLLDYVDFSVSDWWPIMPGDQTIRYAPVTASSGAAAHIFYRPSWL